MASHFEDDDFGFPIASLRRSRYVLFDNGIVGISPINEEESYDFLYSSPDKIDYQIEDSDTIPSEIKILRRPFFLWVYTAILAIFYFILEFNSWSIIAQTDSIEFGRSMNLIPASIAFLWIVISFLPIIIYDYRTRDLTDERSIMIKQYHRPQSPEFLMNKEGIMGDWLQIFTYFQTLAVVGSVLTFRPGREGSQLLESVLVANILLVSILIVIGFFWVGGFLNRLVFPDSKRKVPELSLDKFYEKIDATIKSWKEMNLEKKGTQRSIQELLEHNEDINLEFKASMWATYRTENKISTGEVIDLPDGRKNLTLQDEVLGTVAAFLNTAGGTLLIGVKDKPKSWKDRPAEVYGVDPDYKWVHKKDSEGYMHAVRRVLDNGFGETATAAKFVRISITPYGPKEICRIDVDPLPRVTHGEIYVKLRADSSKKEEFFARIGDETEHMSVKSASRFIPRRFDGILEENDES